MLQIQHHRGPDNTGIRTWPEITLGHNRLSILDLSTAGHQPMSDAGDRYHMVFNGEVYNYPELRRQFVPDYPFKSSSDTEVLLAMYAKMGPELLQHLTGMFAFAIWDSKEKKLFAARDRFGVKPFYYACAEGRFLFASEIKTLWEAGIPRVPQTEIWSTFLGSGHYGMPHQTFWQHIQALPAGHMLTLEWNKAPVISSWYHFKTAIAQQPVFKDQQEAESYYESLLLDAVKLRFRSDVAVGFNLSGGVDSSVLFAAVQKLFPDNDAISAFSFYCNDPMYDELPWVKQLLHQSGKSLEAVLLTPGEVMASAEQLSLNQDEPYGGIPTIAYNRLFESARKNNTIVLLDGQGMDEAWAGYDYYHKPGGGIVQGSSSAPVAAHTLEKDFIDLHQELLYEQPFDNALQNMQYRDIFYTKLPRALRFNDRNSMMHGTELREPFLDHRLLEFAFAQPADRKVMNGMSKITLRRIAEKWIGHSLALAPKRPLQTPQREWLRGPLKDWAMAHINCITGPGNPGWFNRTAVLKAWEAYLQGKSDNSFFVWQWINTSMLLGHAA